MGWLKFLGIALAAMPAMFISQHSAHAFPWNEISKHWWISSSRYYQISASFSFEEDVHIEYDGRVYGLYRVLYETPDSALILTGSTVEGEIRYYPEFLCIGHDTVTGNISDLVNATSGVWFTANEKSLLHRDEEFITLSTREILNRIEHHPRFTLDYRHPVDCIKWAENYLHSEKLPYLKNYRPNLNHPVADRTPFPRSGF